MHLILIAVLNFLVLASYYLALCYADLSISKEEFWKLLPTSVGGLIASLIALNVAIRALYTTQSPKWVIIFKARGLKLVARISCQNPLAATIQLKTVQLRGFRLLEYEDAQGVTIIPPPTQS